LLITTAAAYLNNGSSDQVSGDELIHEWLFTHFAKIRLLRGCLPAMAFLVGGDLLSCVFFIGLVRVGLVRVMQGS